MNDPRPEGHNGKPHRTTKILSRASRRRGGVVAARGARAADGQVADHRILGCEHACDLKLLGRRFYAAATRRRDLAASRHRLEDCSDLTPGNVDSLLQRLSGTTVQEIDHFIAELQALRQRLQREATRVERKVVQYASLNEAARASMRTISENLSF